MEVAKDISSAVRINGGGSGEQQAALDFETVYEKVSALVSGNAVVVFTISGCCMCHVVKQLLFGLGVGPTIVELDRDASGGPILALLHRLAGSSGSKRQQAVPAVFVGGKFLGGIETVIACHVSGTLVPLLKDAGALWL
ncbi:Thioredoxin superfamily protein [Perilla frutescens var. hirtella]|uniref:Thioredoxin superfamily protein n=1 Tax=Perilla frutescens var. hirtella TaxID=608512 RepID=A0AAD4P3K5_PERFH|nr:Thioredoxin superfamily protein [Perilla frutescens var. hirtella]KAH6825638.1 Thioredoxin superfamily protein [Perilla frutescens var. hirtella]